MDIEEGIAQNRLDKTFVKVENESEAKHCSFIGDLENRGRRNKNFTIFLNGENLDGERILLKIPVLTPKANKMTKLLFKARKMEDIYNEDSIEEMIEFMQKNYGVSSFHIESLDSPSFQKLATFGVFVSTYPVKTVKKNDFSKGEHRLINIIDHDYYYNKMKEEDNVLYAHVIANEFKISPYDVLEWDDHEIYTTHSFIVQMRKEAEEEQNKIKNVNRGRRRYGR